ncbi:hypothetical protein [Veronia pacifica]|uniref:Uncharacterized protein n=1 Tax=Veronia pacifica TaxID=1080227 RepID=A0A1C3E8Z7_9GAMM|nr:hypothetical protein [Veronia pacifica]ODA29691.1 hypothetical protein A8L45_21945 [Veronia pacifica]
MKKLCIAIALATCSSISVADVVTHEITAEPFEDMFGCFSDTANATVTYDTQAVEQWKSDHFAHYFDSNGTITFSCNGNDVTATGLNMYVSEYYVSMMVDSYSGSIERTWWDEKKIEGVEISIQGENLPIEVPAELPAIRKDLQAEHGFNIHGRTPADDYYIWTHARLTSVNKVGGGITAPELGVDISLDIDHGHGYLYVYVHQLTDNQYADYWLELTLPTGVSIPISEVKSMYLVAGTTPITEPTDPLYTKIHPEWPRGEYQLVVHILSEKGEYASTQAPFTF